MAPAKKLVPAEARKTSVFEKLLQICFKKGLQFFPWNEVTFSAIVEVAVGGFGDNHQFLVGRVFAVFYHIVVGSFSHVAAVGFFAVDDEDSRADFVGICQKAGVHKAC